MRANRSEAVARQALWGGVATSAALGMHCTRPICERNGARVRRAWIESDRLRVPVCEEVPTSVLRLTRSVSVSRSRVTRPRESSRRFYGWEGVSQL